MVTTPLVLADERQPGGVIVKRARTTDRVCARARGFQLDRALAAGVSPDSSAMLSVRAHQLIGAPARSALALTIRRLIEDTDRRLQPTSLNVPICRRKVRNCKHALQDLAHRLVAAGPLDVRGLAQIRLLLSDGRGPLYNYPSADDLAPAIERAITALELPNVARDAP